MGIKIEAGFLGDKGQKVHVSMELLSFIEDDTYILYSPSLDLSGYGKNEAEAQESFVISLNEFFKYTLNKKTLFGELKRLVWEKKGSKKKPTYKPPYLDTLFSERDYLKEIVRDKNFTKRTEQVLLPAM